MPRIDEYDIMTKVMGLNDLRDRADESDDRSSDQRLMYNQSILELYRQFFDALYNGHFTFAAYLAKENNWPKEDVDRAVLFWFHNGH